MKTRWKSRQRFRNRLTGIALAFVMTAACIIAALGGTAHAAEPLNNFCAWLKCGHYLTQEDIF